MWRLPPRGLPETGAFVALTADRLGAEDDPLFAAIAVEPSRVTAGPPGPARRPARVGDQWVFVPLPLPDSAPGVGLRAAGQDLFRSAARTALRAPSSSPRREPGF